MDGWMDGWMDGEDLIRCLAVWTLYKRWFPLTFVDFRVVSIASRNRLRLASHFGSKMGRKSRRKVVRNHVLLTSFSSMRFGR